jgi:hypothetical protein
MIEVALRAFCGSSKAALDGKICPSDFLHPALAGDDWWSGMTREFFLKCGMPSSMSLANKDA